MDASPFGRDIIRELALACRCGCLYLSTLYLNTYLSLPSRASAPLALACIKHQAFLLPTTPPHVAPWLGAEGVCAWLPSRLVCVWQARGHQACALLLALGLEPLGLLSAGFHRCAAAVVRAVSRVTRGVTCMRNICWPLVRACI